MMGQRGKPGCIDCVDGICDMNCGPADITVSVDRKIWEAEGKPRSTRAPTPSKARKPELDLMDALNKSLAGNKQKARKQRLQNRARARALTDREYDAILEALDNRLAGEIDTGTPVSVYESARKKIMVHRDNARKP